MPCFLSKPWRIIVCEAMAFSDCAGSPSRSFTGSCARDGAATALANAAASIAAVVHFVMRVIVVLLLDSEWSPADFRRRRRGAARRARWARHVAGFPPGLLRRCRQAAGIAGRRCG